MITRDQIEILRDVVKEYSRKAMRNGPKDYETYMALRGICEELMHTAKKKEHGGKGLSASLIVIDDNVDLDYVKTSKDNDQTEALIEAADKAKNPIFKEDILMGLDPWVSVGCNSKQDLADVYHKIHQLTYHPHGPAIKQLIEWRKLGDKVEQITILALSLVRGSELTMKRINDQAQDRSNKRWTAEEDEQLIEYVCREGASIITATTIFGRSPGAIKQRVSQLVGIKRMSQEVAGKFIGTLNGANIEGNIRGQLVKQN